MKKIICIFFTMILLAGCKKAVENAQEDAVINAMTNGQWVVTNYMNGSTDATTDFNGYKFQFHSNRTVDAIKNNSIEKTGTWDANSTTRTITSTFTNANSPLSLLNGTWTITRNSWTYVESNQNVSGELKTLRLDKQ